MNLASIFLILSLSFCTAYRFRSNIDPVAFSSIEDELTEIVTEPAYHWSENFYQNMPIDHFSFSDSRTFQLRYILNTTYHTQNGPILFYTGNEGDIIGFAKNTGLMWDLAISLGGAVVFAEHRFYGKTQPFGDDSYTRLENLGYLSSTQALADFAVLIPYLKNQAIPNAKQSPVIAFGGSYGGMLAAWLRIKYPHVVVGALASSAPVLQFEGTDIDQGIFEQISTRTFVNAGCDKQSVFNAWKAIDELAMTDSGRNYLNNLFHLKPDQSLLQSASDSEWLREFIRGAFEYMAMVDYPYPSNFLKSLPGWPVKVACERMMAAIAGSSTSESLAAGLYQVANLYFNNTGTTKYFCANYHKCEDQSTSVLGSPLGWPWQACTEMAMPMHAEGLPNDFYWSESVWNKQLAFGSCNRTFGHLGYNIELLRPDWILQNYGANFAAASNIIFSNGYLDPWSGGGYSVQPKTKGSIVSVIIDDGAHHYDLRGPHPNDTPSVLEARKLELLYIQKWIKGHWKKIYREETKNDILPKKKSNELMDILIPGLAVE